jgi:hypothetical protein
MNIRRRKEERASYVKNKVVCGITASSLGPLLNPTLKALPSSALTYFHKRMSTKIRGPRKERVSIRFGLIGGSQEVQELNNHP